MAGALFIVNRTMGCILHSDTVEFKLTTSGHRQPDCFIRRAGERIRTAPFGFRLQAANCGPPIKTRHTSKANSKRNCLFARGQCQPACSPKAKASGDSHVAV